MRACEYMMLCLGVVCVIVGLLRSVCSLLRTCEYTMLCLGVSFQFSVFELGFEFQGSAFRE